MPQPPENHGMREVSIGDAFRDDQAARRYLEAALEDGVLPSDTLLPMRKWVQAIYLSNAGKAKVSAAQLAALLNIPAGMARDVAAHLAVMDGLDAIAKGMAASGRTTVLSGLVGSFLLLGKSLQLGGVSLDSALVGLG